MAVNTILTRSTPPARQEGGLPGAYEVLQGDQFYPLSLRWESIYIVNWRDGWIERATVELLAGERFLRTKNCLVDGEKLES